MESNSSDYRKQNLLFAIVLIAVFILQFWKAHIGMGSSDEHFYTTLGYRLARGDALFYDDWHIAQMISVFLYPLVKMYMSVTGGTEGIILFMRYCYIFFTGICGSAIYIRFRTYGITAAIASLIYLLFTPFNIMALSYNTMSVGFLILALMVYPKEDQAFRLFISGILISCAVLNTPYLALLYLILSALAIVKPNIISLNRWLYLTIGALFTAACFLWFVFSRASVSDVFGSLSHLIDPSHSASIPILFVKNIGRLFRFFGGFVIAFLLEPVIAFLLKKKRSEFRNSFLHLSIAVNLASMVYACFICKYQMDLGGLGVILLPLAVIGINYRILNSYDSYLILCFEISWLHAFLLMISSNVGPRSFTGPLILACVVTAFMVSSDSEMYKMLKMGSCLLVVILLAYIKVETVYNGSGEYDTVINQGPLKGLRDSADNYKEYNMLMEDIISINNLPLSFANLVTWNSWEYLACDKRIASNSTYIYFWGKDEYLKCQSEYQETHKNKYPCYVYLDETAAPYEFTVDDLWFLNMTDIGEMKKGHLFILEN